MSIFLFHLSAWSLHWLHLKLKRWEWLKYDKSPSLVSPIHTIALRDKRTNKQKIGCTARCIRKFFLCVLLPLHCKTVTTVQFTFERCMWMIGNRAQIQSSVDRNVRPTTTMALTKRQSPNSHLSSSLSFSFSIKVDRSISLDALWLFYFISRFRFRLNHFAGIIGDGNA